MIMRTQTPLLRLLIFSIFTLFRALICQVQSSYGEDVQDPRLRLHPPRRIFLMVEPTPLTHVSGYANRFNEMLKFLSKAGDQVEVLTVETKPPRNLLPTKVFGYNVSHTRGFTFPLYRTVSISFDLPERKGGKMIKDFRPDIIHVSSPGFILFAAIVYARRMQTPLVMSYHTHLPAYAKKYLRFIPFVERLSWIMLYWAHSFADLTLVTSPQMKEELVAHGIPRVEVWQKGVDTKRFHPKFRSMQMRRRMTAGNPKDFLIVYVGRLGREKRVKDIRAMIQRMPNARLCIVGKGPQDKELREYFSGTNTVFTGELHGDELSSAYASADAFVFPSDTETLGFVVLESMASGVPVVASNAGGVPSIIDDKVTGFLVEPGDTDSFVSRLEELKDPRLRTMIAKKARSEAKRWRWEDATSVLRNVQYEQALNNFHHRFS